MNSIIHHAKHAFKHSSITRLKTWSRFNKKMNQDAFTLIELLIVLAIVSFLTSVFLPTLQEARAKGEDARRVTSAKSLQTEIANQTNVGSTAGGYTPIFTDTNSGVKKKLDKLVADTGLVARTDFSIGSAQTTSNTSIDAYADTTSFVLIIPLKTDATKYWCVDADGNSKQVTGRLNTATAGPKSCNDITLSESTLLPTVLSVGQLPLSGTLVGTKLYITNAESNTLSIIDTSTDTVTGTISVGARPVSATLVGTKLYVNNMDGNTVSVVDTNTNAVVATLSVGFSPITSTLVGTKLYVVNNSSNSLSVIDTTSGVGGAVTNTVSVNAQPQSAVLVGSRLYVNAYSNAVGYVTVVDTSLTTPAVVGSLLSPYSFSSTVIGSKVYVNNIDSNTVKEINTTLGTYGQISSTIAAPSSPAKSLAIGSKLYVVTSGSETITVIDTASGNSIVATISVGANPDSLINIGNKLYVSNLADDTVSVIDLTTNTVIQTIPVPGGPASLIVSGTKIYVLDISANTVSIIQH